jgi:hypothetical protein
MIDVEDELWDAFLTNPLKKSKYGWYRYYAILYWSIIEEVFGDQIAIGACAIGAGNILDKEPQKET